MSYGCSAKLARVLSLIVDGDGIVKLCSHVRGDEMRGRSKVTMLLV